MESGGDSVVQLRSKAQAPRCFGAGHCCRFRAMRGVRAGSSDSDPGQRHRHAQIEKAEEQRARRQERACAQHRASHRSAGICVSRAVLPRRPGLPRPRSIFSMRIRCSLPSRVPGADPPRARRAWSALAGRAAYSCADFIAPLPARSPPKLLWVLHDYSRYLWVLKDREVSPARQKIFSRLATHPCILSPSCAFPALSARSNSIHGRIGWSPTRRSLPRQIMRRRRMQGRTLSPRRPRPAHCGRQPPGPGSAEVAGFRPRDLVRVLNMDTRKKVTSVQPRQYSSPPAY